MYVAIWGLNNISVWTDILYIDVCVCRNNGVFICESRYMYACIDVYVYCIETCVCMYLSRCTRCIICKKKPVDVSI